MAEDGASAAHQCLQDVHRHGARGRGAGHGGGQRADEQREVLGRPAGERIRRA